MKSAIAIGLTVCWLTGTALAVTDPAIIPQPQTIERAEGRFKLTRDSVIVTDAASQDTGKVLAERLRPAMGFSIETSLSKGSDQMFRGGAIVLTTENAKANLGAEGYELSVTPSVVTVNAPTQAGVFYGVQTLLQLLPPEVFSAKAVKDFNWEIPCVKITDGPRFPWRGLMLDVSRHFYTKQEVEKMMDVMALHKLNTFHWHLVDDHGWRIEIKKYPKLTSVGAWRAGVGFGFPTDSTTAYDPDGRYGGFYTQEDIREVVAYAQKLHISRRAGNRNAGPFARGPVGLSGIRQRAGTVHYSAPSRRLSWNLFPGQTGDLRVPAERADGSVSALPRKIHPHRRRRSAEGIVDGRSRCQALMEREGLKSKEELQNWFTRRMEKFISAHGKTLIGWSEIRQGGLPENAVVMDWIGGGREAASQGHVSNIANMTGLVRSFFISHQ